MSCGECVIPFGKHKGKTIDQIAKTDEGLRYLDWLAGQDIWNHQVRLALNEYLSDPLIKDELDKLIKED